MKRKSRKHSSFITFWFISVSYNLSNKTNHYRLNKKLEKMQFYFCSISLGLRQPSSHMWQKWCLRKIGQYIKCFYQFVKRHGKSQEKKHSTYLNGDSTMCSIHIARCRGLPRASSIVLRAPFRFPVFEYVPSTK